MFKKIFSQKFILVLIILFASFLRLYKLSVNPVSLFGDELDLGYQAYSILHTGRDYYGNFMPIHFHSLAEWRTPLYLYSAVPTVAVFGISPLGVRLPAAIFGILSVLMTYLFVKELLSYKSPPTEKHYRSLLAAFLMAISPWSLQYSRAGFEATQMIFLLLLGLWLFFKSFKNDKWLWLSIVSFVLMPWVYSTAKLFTPIFLILILVLFRKEIFSMRKSSLITSIVAGLVVGVPIVYSTLFGGGTQRFNYISVFSDPTIETEVGHARETDARMRGEGGTGLTPSVLDRLIHNKFTFAGNVIIQNYLSAFSTNFLFVKGDPNLRQSIGVGEFYRIEIIALILGIVFFFSEKSRDVKVKVLLIFWILLGVIPAALTRDGGNHATRLILILPPLIFLIAFGWFELYMKFPDKYKKFFVGGIALLYLICGLFYFHEYYVHYPWNSERWWHAGYKEAIQSVKQIDKNYDKVVISTANEPPWIFFAAWYQYPPEAWQKNFPIGNDVTVAGLGKVSHIDKFYFGSYEGGLYDWGKIIDAKTLYLADAKEVNVNLVLEPERTPQNLKLIKAITYPSGEPAFYLFTGVK